ncbi:hypothetical protein, partial [Helicobacter sp. MIT 05-5294]|uniref:hypothetical protein n=1 Tax=Helicobacter sp. MIT 05-5294 TaxID=1548150 RepID=UPI00188324C7
GINANNFKNTPAAVANLEWCNGMPIKTTYKAEVFKIDTNYTINSKNTAYSIGCASASPNYTLSCFLDSKVIFKSRSYSENMGYIIGSNKQVFKATNENFITNMYYLYGQ